MTPNIRQSVNFYLKHSKLGTKVPISDQRTVSLSGRGEECITSSSFTVLGSNVKIETVLAVVKAEARHGKTDEDISSILTLGKASGQTGKEKRTGGCRYLPPKNDFQPWLEFAGIPQDPASPIPSVPFLGEPPSKAGDNLRFVDMCWADIMQNDYADVGQDVLPWAKGLLGRLSRKDEWAQTNNLPDAVVPKWVLKPWTCWLKP